MHKNPTDRALQLLALLQTHRLWGAAELAERLDVTTRTVRRDVDRLRELGYPIDAAPGRHGGYRLTAGARLPPLVFSDDEAVAVAVGIRAAAGAAIRGIEDTSLQALAKIEQVLPHRLRSRVSALHASVATVGRAHGADVVVDSDSLGVLASACRDHEGVRFDYENRDGDPSRRFVEPHQLVSAGHLWYLVAWDLQRTDWRIFRLDRLDRAQLAGRPFTPRELPHGDGAAFLAASVASLPRRLEATVVVRAPHAQVAGALARLDHIALEANEDSCTIRLRSDAMESLVMAVVRLALAAPVRVVSPQALEGEVDALVDRLTQLRDVNPARLTQA